MKQYFTKLKENDKINTVNVLEKGLSIYRRSDLMSLKQKILDARDNYVINQNPEKIVFLIIESTSKSSQRIEKYAA